MSLLKLWDGGGGVSFGVEDGSEGAVAGGDLREELDDFGEFGVGESEVVLLHCSVAGAKGFIGGLDCGRVGLLGRGLRKRGHTDGKNQENPRYFLHHQAIVIWT